MRIWTSLVAALVMVAPLAAHADDREALQAKGEQLAKDGRFGEAIDAFKQADRIQPCASHACLIALAYTRRESWPQAELYLSICHQRANDADPLPDWVAQADQLIKDRLASANLAEVMIVANPATAKVTVSSFAPDEVFEPRTIHLPFGTHVIFAKADGYPDAQATVVINDKTFQRIVIDLTKPAATAPATPTLVDRGTVQEHKPAGTPLLIAGGAAIALGIGAHIWWGYEHGKLDDANANANAGRPVTPDDVQLYNDHSGRYDIAHYSTIGLYVVGVGLAATGVVLRMKSSETPAVAAAPLPGGGAMVSVGWQR